MKKEIELAILLIVSPFIIAFNGEIYDIGDFFRHIISYIPILAWFGYLLKKF